MGKIESGDVNEELKKLMKKMTQSFDDLDKEKLIMDGIEMLKQQQNGKLTDKQQNLLDEKNYKELDKELSKNGIILILIKIMVL